MTATISDFPADRPATAGLSPFADVPSAYRVCMVAAFLLGTIARDALGDPDAVRALLGARSRTQAVKQARALGLLASSARRR